MPSETPESLVPALAFISPPQAPAVVAEGFGLAAPPSPDSSARHGSGGSLAGRAAEGADDLDPGSAGGSGTGTGADGGGCGSEDGRGSTKTNATGDTSETEGLGDRARSTVYYFPELGGEGFLVELELDMDLPQRQGSMSFVLDGEDGEDGKDAEGPERPKLWQCCLTRRLSTWLSRWSPPGHRAVHRPTPAPPATR